MHMRLEQDGDAITLALAGDLDYSTYTVFTDEVARLLDRARVIVLDCRELRFVDSSGVAALIHCYEEAARRGAQVRLAHVAPAVREVLDILGVGDLLGVEPSGP